MTFKINPISGDASFRKFFRLKLNKKSKIIILAEKEKYKNLVVYASINKFLRANKIYAPKLYMYNFSKAIIVIQDFGDNSFFNLLLKKKDKIGIYKKLVDLIIKIQKIKPITRIKKVNKGYYKIKKYSNNQLFKESDLFFDWYLPLFKNKKKSFEIKMKSKKILSRLYNSLNFPNSYFVHRDYHVQNLMKVNNRIGIIDSQDSLIGNPSYDLASLIDDVRIKTSKKLKNDIYNYYLRKSPRIFRKNSKEFFQDFSILSVQRILKIIGIFSRLYTRDKKSLYLKYIPYAWEILEMRINSAFFSDLRLFLDSNIPKKLRKKIINK